MLKYCYTFTGILKSCLYFLHAYSFANTIDAKFFFDEISLILFLDFFCERQLWPYLNARQHFRQCHKLELPGFRTQHNAAQLKLYTPTNNQRTTCCSYLSMPRLVPHSSARLSVFPANCGKTLLPQISVNISLGMPIWIFGDVVCLCTIHSQPIRQLQQPTDKQAI